ncbi:hypothetical protein PWT90_08388 [Aphanocladium album]|nr:hypothetical protein PWT90_08388 [Aphanocladium album]
MNPPECLLELLKLHKDLVVLRQQWWEAARHQWQCLPTSPTDKVSRLLPPKWDACNFGGTTTDLFSLLDVAGGEMLLHQVSLLLGESKNDASFVELTKLLTRRARFQECVRFFKYNGVGIRSESGRFDHCSGDANELLKLFASMTPDVAATIIEKLFALHQNLYFTMSHLVKNIGKKKLINNLDTKELPQNKHVLASTAVAPKFVDSSSNASSAALCGVFYEPILCSPRHKYLYPELMLPRNQTSESIFRALAIRDLTELCQSRFRNATPAVQALPEVGMSGTNICLVLDTENTGKFKSLARMTANDLADIEDQPPAHLMPLYQQSTKPARASRIFHERLALRSKTSKGTETLGQGANTSLRQLADISPLMQKCRVALSMDTSYRFSSLCFVSQLEHLYHRFEETVARWWLRNGIVSVDTPTTNGMARTIVPKVEEFTKTTSDPSLSAHSNDSAIASIPSHRQRDGNGGADRGTSVTIKFDTSEEENLLTSPRLKTYLTDDRSFGSAQTQYFPGDIVDLISATYSDDEDPWLTGSPSSPSFTDDESFFPTSERRTIKRDQCLLHELSWSDWPETFGVKMREDCTCSCSVRVGQITSRRADV